MPPASGPAEPKRVRILVIEDSPADAELLIRELKSGGYEVAATRVETADAMRLALQTETWDVVISDYSLPRFSAPEALMVLRDTGRDLPFIIVSGTIGEEAAVESLRAGACDFLIKGRLARLIPAIERERREIELRRERTREREALEEQLRHAQKMEAIGQLAGGIAHDFNNMLTAILGYAELLTEQIGPDKPIGVDLQEIVIAAQRATSLTRQLLAFSRKQTIKPVALSLNAVVETLEPMLRRLISANVSIRTSLDRQTHVVLADKTQLEQVLMNLVVNARDAMPDGGTLTIATGNATLGASDLARFPGAMEGEYAVITVSDTGVGMPPEVQRRIFEPFYTTKERGRGTGLGLAAVYGIVKQLGGNIWVESEPERGSSFTIYLPRTAAAPVSAAPRGERSTPPIGRETILLVEDESGVRSFARTVLVRYGYNVIEAESSEQALTQLSRYDGPLDLLLTDVMLSGMDGGQLARHLTPGRPNMRVIFMSGYADPSVEEGLPDGCGLLEKPFTAHTLLSRVRESLSSRVVTRAS
jgi:two-component system cell cycle sensor histidine kinase/response regulator CckA